MREEKKEKKGCQVNFEEFIQRFVPFDVTGSRQYKYRFFCNSVRVKAACTLGKNIVLNYSYFSGWEVVMCTKTSKVISISYNMSSTFKQIR